MKKYLFLLALVAASLLMYWLYPSPKAADTCTLTGVPYGMKLPVDGCAYIILKP